MNTNLKKLALAIGALVMAGGAMADTATMGVSASIVDECSVGGTITPLTFGNLAMLNSGAASAVASVSSGGAFEAICTNNTSNTPALSFTSANAVATASFRLKGVDNSYIVYSLAESGGEPIAYGTPAEFTDFIANGQVIPLAITGSIAALEKAGKKVQAYSDTITITSSFAP